MSTEMIVGFYTNSEESALKRHAHTKNLNASLAARGLASKASLLRVTLGASPNSYTGWKGFLEQAKRDIEEIEKRAAR